MFTSGVPFRAHHFNFSPGGRTAKEIVTWLIKRTGPPAEALNTAEEAEAFSKKDEVVVIGFFEDAESDNARAYINAADTQETIFFGIVTSKDVAESMDATMDSVVVFKQFDEGRATFDGEYTTEDIVTFVLGEQLPLVTTFNDQVPEIQCWIGENGVRVGNIHLCASSHTVIYCVLTSVNDFAKRGQKL